MAALLTLEFGLRPFARGMVAPAMPSMVLETTAPELGVREVRQFHEGWGIAHFGPDGVRLTGNPQLAGAPTALIVGDSFVEAEGVRDESTMGAVVERLARVGGRPLNVRQYGWSGASVPSYLATAQALVARWRPTWTAIPVTADDFGTVPLTGSRFWRFDVHDDLSIDLIPVPRTVENWTHWLAPLGFTASNVSHALESSTLLFLTVEFLQRAREAERVHKLAVAESTAGAQEKSQKTKRVLYASLRALRAAYGPGLLLLYVPSFGVSSDATPDPFEQDWRTACEQEAVRCLSLRPAMLAERQADARLPAGFHNTAPGAGHLNAVGHRLAGSEIWRVMRDPGSPGD